MTTHANSIRVLLVLLAILFTGIGGAAQIAPSKQDSPSLEDTLKWIRTKLSTFSYLRDKESGDLEKTEDISYSGCTVDIQLSTRHNASSGHIFKQLTRYSFSLKDAERADAFPDRNGQTKVALGFKLKIPGTTENYIDSDLQNKEEEREAAIFLPFHDKDLAQRVATAFQHAIKLCGGGKVKEIF